MIVRENINFERGKDPKESMGIGMINKITSYDLEILAVTIFCEDWCPADPRPEEDERFLDFKKENPQMVDFIIDLERRGIIEFGKFFEWDNIEGLEKYIMEENDGRYVYDAGPNLGGHQVLFSEIKLPNVDDFSDIVKMI